MEESSKIYEFFFNQKNMNDQNRIIEKFQTKISHISSNIDDSRKEHLDFSKKVKTINKIDNNSLCKLFKKNCFKIQRPFPERVRSTSPTENSTNSNLQKNNKNIKNIISTPEFQPKKPNFDSDLLEFQQLLNNGHYFNKKLIKNLFKLIENIIM